MYIKTCENKYIQTLVLILMSELCDMRYFTTSRCPISAATLSGVEFPCVYMMHIYITDYICICKYIHRYIQYMIHFMHIHNIHILYTMHNTHIQIETCKNTKSNECRWVDFGSVWNKALHHLEVPSPRSFIEWTYAMLCKHDTCMHDVIYA